jgi:hypothetical protein
LFDGKKGKRSLQTFIAMLGSSNETSMYLSPRLAASRARYCSEEGEGEGEREREREGGKEEVSKEETRGREEYPMSDQEVNFEFPAYKICTMHHVPPQGNAHSHEEDKNS